MKSFQSIGVLFFLLVLFCGPVLAEEPEVLLGLSTDFAKSEISIQVAGSGCTQKGDFRFELKNNVLTIFRKQRDACKAMPQKISLVYSLKEIGIDPHQRFTLSNAFVVNKNITN